MRRILLLSLVACAPPSGERHLDSECDGFTCANTNECLSADEVRRVAMPWPIPDDGNASFDLP